MKKELATYTARRIVLSSPKPVSEVLEVLHKELKKDKEGLVAEILLTSKDRAEVDSRMNELYDGGERTFTYVSRPMVSEKRILTLTLLDRLFSDMPHSRWMNTYFAGEQAFETTHAITFGQPMLAKEMLKLDMGIGLFVPPRALVQGIKGGGTKITYQLPTSWLGDPAPEELKELMQLAESKMEVFFTGVLNG